MPIKYNNKRLIPAPLVNITKEYQKTDNQEKIGSVFSITLQGTIIPHRGSPNSSGDFETTDFNYPADEADENRLDKILSKQHHIRDLFSEEGKEFEIIGCDGSQRIVCFPLVNEINFNDGLWVNRCDYSVTLQCDWVSGEVTGFSSTGALSPSGEDGFAYLIRSATESWDITESTDMRHWDENEDKSVPVFNITHNVSAVGKRTYGTNASLARQPWENAREYVKSKMGFDTNIASAEGTINIASGYQPLQHMRNAIIDIAGGGYTLNETWIFSSGNSIDEFVVTTTSGAEDGITRVSIQGQIKGLDTVDFDPEYNTTLDRYAIANSYWGTGVQPNLVSRAESFSGVDVNNTPFRTVVTANATMGIINYNYEYDTRTSCIDSSFRNENVEIVDIAALDIFAEIPIPGKASGPVLQDMETVTARRKAVSVEVTVENTNDCADFIAAPASVIASVSGFIFDGSTGVYSSISGFDQVFKVEDTHRWNPQRGVLSWNVGWVYNSC